MRTVSVGDVPVGGDLPLVLIAGPCVIESREHCLHLAQALAKLAGRHEIPFIFKTSYDKANRTSGASYRGPGLAEGLDILAQVRREHAVPVLCDVHSPQEAPLAAQVVDALQIPAFLCRQTDLLCAAAATGKPVNIKKGQFLAPWDVKHIIEKVTSTGNQQVLLTERGTSFGYNYLVSDMRSLVILRSLEYPVVFDATHSVQMPGAKGVASGGERAYVAPLARAACAVGIHALFVEVHDDPDNALCDGPNMLALGHLSDLLSQAKAIDRLVRGQG